MAEDGKSNITSAYPAPPAHYKLFTSENVDRLQEHFESSGQAPLSAFNPLDPNNGPLPDINSIPKDLQGLIPPPLPENGAYRTFNTIHYVNPTPASELPTTPSQEQLVQVLRQILVKFLHITHLLSLDPSMKYYVPAWTELERLFKEMHTGINAWRPHQAKEMLIQMMEEQIHTIRAESERCRQSVQKAREVVEGIGKEDVKTKQTGVVEVRGKESREEEAWKRKKSREKRVWDVIQREVGKIGDDNDIAQTNGFN